MICWLEMVIFSMPQWRMSILKANCWIFFVGSCVPSSIQTWRAFPLIHVGCSRIPNNSHSYMGFPSQRRVIHGAPTLHLPPPSASGARYLSVAWRRTPPKPALWATVQRIWLLICLNHPKVVVYSLISLSAQIYPDLGKTWVNHQEIGEGKPIKHRLLGLCHHFHIPKMGIRGRYNIRLRGL